MATIEYFHVDLFEIADCTNLSDYWCSGIIPKQLKETESLYRLRVA